MPILIAARGPKMLRLAGAVADIVHLALPFLDERVINENLAVVRDAVISSGRRRAPEIDLTVALSIDEDEERARRAAKAVAAIGLQWTTNSEQDLRSTSHVRDAHGEARQVAVDPGFLHDLASRWNAFSSEPLPDDLAAQMSDELVNQFVVAGTPEQCGRQLASLLKRCPGVTGLRLKLTKAPGPKSLERYATMARLAGSLRGDLEPVASPAGAR